MARVVRTDCSIGRGKGRHGFSSVKSRLFADQGNSGVLHEEVYSDALTSTLVLLAKWELTSECHGEEPPTAIVNVGGLEVSLFFSFFGGAAWTPTCVLQCDKGMYKLKSILAWRAARGRRECRRQCVHPRDRPTSGVVGLTCRDIQSFRRFWCMSTRPSYMQFALARGSF